MHVELGQSQGSAQGLLLSLMDLTRICLNVIVWLSVFLAILDMGCNALIFKLEPNARKCLSEEVHKDVLVAGEYTISEGAGQQTDLQVTDSKGNILVNRDNTHGGKFAFTTDDYDVFEVCFINKVPHASGIILVFFVLHVSFCELTTTITKIGISLHFIPGTHLTAQEVHLTIKLGVEAKSYENLGEASKLKPLEVELKRLEDLSESIVQDFAYMRQREEEMRDTNESTNSRVLYLSIFSMCCLLGLATWQVLYLRKYFKSKKLID
ncbi:unnamed protein product [Darwinula stevensoni]|uniref:GOLD domain-containing protein n=1 Tax=Darwinula stevensoni TaxID=69355 RepID=A0A7R8XDH1_9CRUS|nr:unnamed protein product [Darwinula stevensoni]CAG0886810.1 unnamed protein product [Darwinula stevensoni]